MPKPAPPETGAVPAAGAIVAGLIGAGFASGQEVLQFFTVYGPLRGLLGAALATAVLGGGAALLLRPAGARGVFRRCCGPLAGRLLESASPLLLFAVYTVMLAGAGALVETGLGLPALWGRAGMLLATLVTAWAGLGRMADILGGVGPLIVAFVLAAGIGAALRGPTGQPVPPLPAPPASRWWWAALVYAGYNLYLLAPFLQALGGRLAGKAAACRAAWLGCGGFGLGLALLHLAFCLAPEALTASAPAVALVGRLWPRALPLAVPVLLAGVYTTAAPLLFGVRGALPAARTPSGTLLLAAAAFGGSALPFGRLIALLTPLIGAFGLALAAGAAWQWAAQRKKRARARLPQNRLYPK